MGLKDDIIDMKEEVKAVRNQSLAMELLSDYKKTNKRQFIIIIVLLILWFSSIGLFIYYINTTGYEVVTETAQTVVGVVVGSILQVNLFKA